MTDDDAHYKLSLVTVYHTHVDENSSARVSEKLIFGHQHPVALLQKSQRNAVFVGLSHLKNQKGFEIVSQNKVEIGFNVVPHILLRTEQSNVDSLVGEYLYVDVLYDWVSFDLASS